jgi:hypothetical protein
LVCRIISALAAALNYLGLTKEYMVDFGRRKNEILLKNNRVNLTAQNADRLMITSKLTLATVEGREEWKFGATHSKQR